MWFLIVFYVALDAESGVATGMQLQYNNGLEAAQKDIVVRAVDAQNNGLVTILVAMVGTIGWLLGALAAAKYIRMDGADHRV